MLSIFFLYFFLVSCSTPTHQWRSDQSLNCFPHFQSSKIYLPPQNQFSGIEMEIVQGSYGQRMYLNVFSIHLSVNPETPSKIFVTLIFNNETCVVEADLFDGGQHVLLPEEAKEKIIEHLLDNQTVSIKMGRYSTEITPSGFVKKYKSLANSI